MEIKWSRNLYVLGEAGESADLVSGPFDQTGIIRTTGVEFSGPEVCGEKRGTAEDLRGLNGP